MVSNLLIVRTIQNLSYSGKLISASNKGIEVCINEKGRDSLLLPKR